MTWEQDNSLFGDMAGIPFKEETNIILMIFTGIISIGLIVVFVSLIFYAIIKSDEFHDGVRAERCARYGENLPQELEKYCDEPGV